MLTEILRSSSLVWGDRPEGAGFQKLGKYHDSLSLAFILDLGSLHQQTNHTHSGTFSLCLLLVCMSHLYREESPKSPHIALS